MVSTYNWAKFVLNWLVNEVTRHKICESKVGTSSQQSVGECLFLLMIIYFEHGPKGMKLDLDLATESSLGFWTTERVIELLRFESNSSQATSHLLSHLQLRHPATQNMYRTFVKEEFSRICL